jgi:hypothetical protein
MISALKPLLFSFASMWWLLPRKGQAPLSQIAKDFGISKPCLHRRLQMAI